MEVHRRYIFILRQGKESVEKILNELNTFYPTITFTAKYTKEAINVLDVI